MANVFNARREITRALPPFSCMECMYILVGGTSDTLCSDIKHTHMYTYADIYVYLNLTREAQRGEYVCIYAVD